MQLHVHIAPGGSGVPQLLEPILGDLGVEYDPCTQLHVQVAPGGIGASNGSV